MKLSLLAGPLALAAGSLLVANVARADGTVVVQPSPPPQPAVVQSAPPARSYRDTGGDYEGPNRHLLFSGIIGLGISYGTSVVIASESTNHSDQNLYVPVFGPWLDIGDRGRANGDAAETGNKIGLVVDGVIQGVSAISIITSFFTPERRAVVVAEAKKPKVHVAPTTYGRGAPGFSLFGTF